MAMLSNLLHGNRFTPATVAPFEQKLFFEGTQRRASLARFGALLFLSVVIATAGILGDSTATVIGAMIIAPLMTPIMATTAALVTGRMDRAGRSLLLVGAGVGGVIALVWLLGTAYTRVLSFESESNSQITSHIHPRAVDLIAAATALVAVPLVTTGLALSRDVRQEQRVRQIAEAWAAETGYIVRSVQVNGDRAMIVIYGSGEVPPFTALVTDIERAARRPVAVELETVPTQRQRTSNLRSEASQ